ncbi:hypothetical protein COCOBI_05-5150 [Coccomyxa sp. Obi]|nr:hypothetical protein COCOBI_05-5150 [Coccomyxa sp. Obi]
MVKEVKHSKEVHQRTGTTKHGNDPHKQSSRDEEVEDKETAEGVGHPEKRVIARQDSHLTKSEKHKDIQDLERRMAQAAIGETEVPEKAEGYTAEERFAAEEPSAAALELATHEVEHAKEILRYLAEDGSKSAEGARQRVDQAEKRIAEIRGRSRERAGSIEDKMSRLATEEKKLHGEAAKALEAAEKELAAARRERERLEEERGDAIDRESAHVYETEQLAKQVDNEYESALRAQELKVVDRMAEEQAKKKQVNHEQVQQAIKQEHETLIAEKDALEKARKQVEQAKMEQVYLAEELTRKLDRTDYAIKEAEGKLERIRREYESQLAAVHAELAATRRELEHLRAEAERLEKTAEACIPPSSIEDLAAAKRDSDRLHKEREQALDAESARVYAAEMRVRQLREKMQGKGTKSGSGTGGAAHKEGKGKDPQPSEKHSPGPVASGLDILDEDDRRPGCDPDKLREEVEPVVVKEAWPLPDCDISPAEVPEVHLYPCREQGPGGQTAGAKSMEASVKAKEVQEQMAQEAEAAAKLREMPQRTGHGKHGEAMMSTQKDPVGVKQAAKKTAEKTTETAKEKAHKAKEYAEDPERAKAAAHETAQQAAHKTKHAKEEIKQKSEETAPGVTGKAKAVAKKADNAVEVSAQKVEGTLRTAAGAAKSAVDTLMGRRSEE